MGETNALQETDLVSVTSGVDWLTYVTPHGEDGERMLAFGYGVVAEQIRLGAKGKPMSTHGYKGEQTASAAVGERDDGVYVRLSGGVACSKWAEIGLCGGHPTRLDIQTTFQLKRRSVRCGQDMFTPTPQSRAPRGRPPLYSFSTDTHGAWIGRAGSRSSRAYLRVYDKGQESGSHPPGNLWRIEAELKREYAEEQWKNLQRAPDAGTYCYASSAFWAQRSGLDWPLPTPSETVSLNPLPERIPPEVEAVMEWLRVQIRPSVQRMVAAGYQAGVMRALGLALEQRQPDETTPDRSNGSAWDSSDS